MAGEYRTEELLAKLPSELADSIRNGLRIGFADQPMTGVTVLPSLSNDLANAYEAAGEQKYADGLRSGKMVPLIPGSHERTWAPGELFFLS